MKMIPVETAPGIREGRIKESSEGGELSMIYMILVRSFVNATMYSHAAQQ
jgi:hypothetical protein